jgi:arylsulfatase A-like enzyme
LTKLGPHEPGEVRPVVQEMVEAVDDGVGKIMSAVRRLNLNRPTFVFFTSDNGGYQHYGGRFHGEISDNGPLRGQKTQVWEGGHRVPAIAWWPGRIEGGRVTDQTVLTMDLMPTLFELAGVESSAKNGISMDGISLTGLLFEDRALPDRTVFWRARERKAARHGPWKLVIEEGKTRLFNLTDDIGESQDLADQNPEQLRELRKQLAAWERDVDSNRPAGVSSQ